MGKAHDRPSPRAGLIRGGVGRKAAHLAIFRSDHRAWPDKGIGDPFDYDAVVRGEAGEDDASPSYMAEPHRFRDDFVVRPDRHHNLARLIRARSSASGINSTLMLPPNNRSLPKVPGSRNKSLFSKMARPRMTPPREFSWLSTKSITRGVAAAPVGFVGEADHDRIFEFARRWPLLGGGEARVANIVGLRGVEHEVNRIKRHNRRQQ